MAGHVSSSMTCNLHISLTPFRNESRVLKETESLIRAGIADSVRVVALHEEGLAESEDIGAARKVFRLKLRTRALPKNIVGQLFKYMEFAWRTLKIARAERPKIHNVHSVGLLPIGVILKRLLGGKLVYDAHELETEANGLAGIRKRGAQLIEWLTIRYADLVIVVSPSIERWYRDRYPRLPVVTVLNAPRRVTVVRSSRLRDALGVPDHLRIALYQGGLEANRGIEELIEAAPRLLGAGYAVIFMGYGSKQVLVQKAAAQSKGVYFHPAVPPADVLGYTASADVGISSIRGESLSYFFSLPNKLFEYIAAGIPCIVSALPEMEAVVTKHEIGVCVSEWTAGSLVEALRKVDAMQGPDLALRLQAAAKEYCWEQQEMVMIDSYRKMMGKASIGVPAT